MNIERLEAKIEVLGLISPDVLAGPVADRALRQCINLMNFSISSHTPSDDSERLALLRLIRRIVAILPLPQATGAIDPNTSNEFSQALQNVINATQEPAVHEEAVLAMVDLERSGVSTDRQSSANRLGELIETGQPDSVQRVVSHLGGPAMKEWPECVETLLRRCTHEPSLFQTLLADASDEEKGPWVRAMLPRNPLGVLELLDDVELYHDDWTFVCEFAIEHAASLAPQQQAEILAQVAGALSEQTEEILNDFSQGLVRLLTTGNEVVAAQGLRLLQMHPQHFQGPGRSRQVVSSVFGWLNAIADKHQPSAIDSVVLLQGQLTQEERQAFVGMLFVQGIQDEARPEAVEHSLGALAAIGVRYDKGRGPNFEDIRNKYGASDQTMRDAIGRGLRLLKPARLPRTIDARAFWEWVNGLAA